MILESDLTAAGDALEETHEFIPKPSRDGNVYEELHAMKHIVSIGDYGVDHSIYAK